ncbi:Methyltransferase domain-containing protein [Halovenus aranensis]|uniref:Methyltransferase domain-containing protein n=1 Tax=Halovenus aranensis TaxID=890420 RepID=A0A1G8WQ00_9EURY|nr:class I SAM-dependent methyltransferase [Halovenus aranensis]SDJ80251.1 Methyltransferase domain-containing protein [Halovenus aranensis]
MRQFTAEYLESTRAGMWEDSLDALCELDLEDRQRVLDVGAGTGELTRTLRNQTAGTVVALDADRTLLDHVAGPRLRGDATRLPFADGSFDLVVCQALLVNLPDPAAVIEEFARVSADRVAVIEPDNSAVAIESTVTAEAPLARRARERYLDGVETDAALGAVPDLFVAAGLENVRVERYDHERRIESPYSERALEDARRKASGTGIDADRETILAGDTSTESFEALREEWRAMGREVIEQMQNGTYCQREVVPFYVTSGRL